MITKDQKNVIKAIPEVTGIKCHRDGTVTAFHSYFYHGISAEGIWQKVLEVVPNAVKIGSGDHFHDFVGGSKAGSATDSYVWVKFIIPDEE